MSAPMTFASGYLAKTWTTSLVNSEVHFSVRHLGVSTSAGDRRIDGSLSVDGKLGNDPVSSVDLLGPTATTTLRKGEFGFVAKEPPLIVGEDIAAQLDIHATREL